MYNYYDIIRRPIVSEKSMKDAENGTYVFEVQKSANKIEIHQAIEKIFNVKVGSVRIINLPSKKRTRGRSIGRVPGIKKAIIKLTSGKINVFGKV